MKPLPHVLTRSAPVSPQEPPGHLRVAEMRKAAAFWGVPGASKLPAAE